MSRPTTIESDELLARISRVFRDVGYEGASLAVLSEATGLKRASLYHRFPGGKEQMAGEALAAAEAWLEENVRVPLRSGAPPRERLATMLERLGAFYEGGERACLLNALSAPVGAGGPFADAIRRTLEGWIEALALALIDAGLAPDAARARATRAVSLLQGGLVLARGLGTAAPFRAALDGLADEMLA